MKLLFVLSGASTITKEALGMAQLAAAFGQDVSLWHPQHALDNTQLVACHDAGITQLGSDVTHLHQWLTNAERVVRL